MMTVRFLYELTININYYENIFHTMIMYIISPYGNLFDESKYK